MRICELRAALAATLEVDRWVLQDPRGWLGTRFHRVVEAMRSGANRDDAELVWNAAVAQAAATASLLDSFHRQVRLYAVLLLMRLNPGRFVAKLFLPQAKCSTLRLTPLLVMQRLMLLLPQTIPREPLRTASPTRRRLLVADVLSSSYALVSGSGLPTPAYKACRKLRWMPLVESLEPGPDGDLYTAHLSVRSASPQLAREQPVVLCKSIHGSLADSDMHNACRVVGGMPRPDGRLCADPTTIYLSSFCIADS